MKRIVTTAALMVLAVTAATASPSGEIYPDLAPSLYAVPLFNHAVPVRYGDLDLAEVAAAGHLPVAGRHRRCYTGPCSHRPPQSALRST